MVLMWRTRSASRLKCRLEVQPSHLHRRIGRASFSLYPVRYTVMDFGYKVRIVVPLIHVRADVLLSNSRLELDRLNGGGNCEVPY